MDKKTFSKICNSSFAEDYYGHKPELRSENSIQFEKELTQLINKHSIENVLDMPDFLIAEMLVNIINSIGYISKKNLVMRTVLHPICHPKSNMVDLNNEII